MFSKSYFKNHVQNYGLRITEETHIQIYETPVAHSRSGTVNLLLRVIKEQKSSEMKRVVIKEKFPWYVKQVSESLSNIILLLLLNCISTITYA